MKGLLVIPNERPAYVIFQASLNEVNKLFLLPYYVDNCLFFSLMIKSSV